MEEERGDLGVEEVEGREDLGVEEEGEDRGVVAAFLETEGEDEG